MKFKNKPLRIACDGGAASGKSLAARLVGKKYCPKTKKQFQKSQLIFLKI